MSGGSLDYFYCQLQEHVGDFGDKELDELVKDLAQLFHDREWYLSADTCRGDWVEARDAFKAKWFTGNCRQERIEAYLEDIKAEVFDAFGISDKYCKNCTHWTKDESDGYEKYGNCDITPHCLMHRSEWCDKFE